MQTITDVYTAVLERSALESIDTACGKQYLSMVYQHVHIQKWKFRYTTVMTLERKVEK